ncbi:MAG: sigma-70 family RNA polymerase sigma factor [Trueperaceae bacterium]
MHATVVERAASDAELMRRVVEGSEDALAALYHRHGGVVLALARRMLDSREEAEEVLHDAFLRLWRSAGRYREERSAVRTYLFSIARNECLSRLRARSARPRAIAGLDPHDPAFAVVANDDGDPVDGILARRALASLQGGERELLEEAYFGGWSHAELSERHGLPLGTVKSKLRRALLKMRAALEKGGAEDER